MGYICSKVAKEWVRACYRILEEKKGLMILVSMELLGVSFDQMENMLMHIPFHSKQSFHCGFMLEKNLTIFFF